MSVTRCVQDPLRPYTVTSSTSFGFICSVEDDIFAPWKDRITRLNCPHVKSAPVTAYAGTSGRGHFLDTLGRGHMGLWAFQGLGTSGCGHFKSWAHRAVDISGRGRIGLWTLQVVGTSGCGHFKSWAHQAVDTSGCGYFRSWAHRAVDISGRGHIGLWTLQVSDTAGP